MSEDGNLLFSRAIRSLETGDFDEADRLFGQTLRALGTDHPTSMLTMKSMIEIRHQKGDQKGALGYSLDLFDAQSRVLGVNHSESKKTVNSIVNLCQALGKEDLAAEILGLVKGAQTNERATAQGQRKQLRDKDDDVPDVAKVPLAQKLLAPVFDPVITILASSGERRSGAEQPLLWLIGAVLVLNLVGSAILRTQATNVGNTELSQIHKQFKTADDVGFISFLSDRRMVVKADAPNYEASYKALGFELADIAEIVDLANCFQKEYWLQEKTEGLMDRTGRTFYRYDAPELKIAKRMRTVCDTATQYYLDRHHYPGFITDISPTKFSYLNRFTLREDHPIIQLLTMKDDDKAGALVSRVQAGEQWPEEPVLNAGAINCLSLSSSGEKIGRDWFVAHSCDRNGELLRAVDGKPYVVVGLNGLKPASKPITQQVIFRSPQVYIIRSTDQLTIYLLAFLTFRFPMVLFAISFVLYSTVLQIHSARLRAIWTLGAGLVLAAALATLVSVYFE